MADLLALSTKIIDEGITDEPTNRITHELSELSDDIAKRFGRAAVHRAGVLRR